MHKPSQCTQMHAQIDHQIGSQRLLRDFQFGPKKQQIRLYFVLNLHESWEQSRDKVAGKNLP